jgi:hypothetical protein
LTIADCRWIGRGERGVHHHRADLAPVTGEAAADLVLVAVLAADHEVARTASEGTAVADARVQVGAVAFAGDAVVELRFQALELAVQNDVDRAGEGIRAVSRRRAAGDHLDPRYERRGNEVQVDRAFAGGGREAAAVDEHQVAGDAEAAQVHDLRTDVEAAEAIGGRVVGGPERRQFGRPPRRRW